MVFQKGAPGPCEITWANSLEKPCGKLAPPSCKCGLLKQWTLHPEEEELEQHKDYEAPKHLKGVHKRKFLYFCLNLSNNKIIRSPTYYIVL